MDTNNPKLAVIVPCYNEEEILKESSDKLLNLINNLIHEQKISEDSYICFVDDGSIDTSWDIINELTQNFQHLKAIKFACNFGHQKALLCGMTENDADIYITIDCDLQDDITVIPYMIELYKSKNADVVYGIRNDRSTDPFWKRMSAQIYYNIMSLMGVKVLQDSADFRLVSKNVVEILKNYKEHNIYLRGLIYSLGFKSEKVYYKRLKRTNGKTKFTLSKMLSFASDGITSSTEMPVRIISLSGLIIFLTGILKMSSTFLIGGLNLLGIGIIGEYIVKTNTEVKNRPNWIIKEKKNY